MTITQNDITQLAARRLISGPLPNEKAIQLWLAMLLVSLGYEVEIEYPVPSGHMDIFLPKRRVVIETKPLDEADPNGVRDPETGETQFQQCQRYVREGWKLERGRLDIDGLGDLEWKAILTDGRVWWMWQWKILQDRELGRRRTIVANRRYHQIVAKRSYRQSADALVAGVQYLIQKRWGPRRRSQRRLPGFQRNRG